MDEQEIWRPIKGYDGRYEVSNLGRVKSCAFTKRVMGYFRPTSFYNRGKKSEFEERVNFTEAAVAKHNQKEARQ